MALNFFFASSTAWELPCSFSFKNPNNTNLLYIQSTFLKGWESVKLPVVQICPLQSGSGWNERNAHWDQYQKRACDNLLEPLSSYYCRELGSGRGELCPGAEGPSWYSDERSNRLFKWVVQEAFDSFSHIDKLLISNIDQTFLAESPVYILCGLKDYVNDKNE